MQKNNILISAAGVSVVIPAYNAASFIADALDSIDAQNPPPKEIIVVNDGSSDLTSQVVQDWIARKKPVYTVCLHTQKNRGISATRNVGIGLASGQWIAFLDADDIWEPIHLERLVSAIAGTPSAVAAYGAGRLFADGVVQNKLYDDFWDNPSKQFGREIQGSSYFLIDSKIFPRLVKGNFIKPSSLMVSKAAIDKIGLFSEILGTAEDREFLIRLVFEGNFVYCAEPISRYRWHDDNASQSKNAKRNAENGLRAIRLVRDNKNLSLSRQNISFCNHEIRLSTKDYLYICCQKGWSGYLDGLRFITEFSGLPTALRALNFKHMARCLLASATPSR